MTLLRTIRHPEDVRQLTLDQVSHLAQEIRELLISTVSRTGGHLGSNLGVVELTIALHRVFRSPHDKIVFDTGHQAYVHKLLTGRCHGFPGLRQAGGLSGYPSRDESPHDLVENSHASTALSYADGLSKAHLLRGENDRHVVALIGDGALTGGMAWEALNNIAVLKDRPLVIVVNDNGRSYSPTVGGLNREILQALGVHYLGPVDGHDEGAVEDALRRARALGRVAIVHCMTSKGRGYPPAEADDADRLHSPGPFDRVTGAAHPGGGPSWTTAFAEELVRIGAGRPDIVAITAAMPGPTGLDRFAAAFPGRVFDVGIAEQHAVTSAAGLAMGGLHPVVAIYSTFLSRAFDQVLLDVALHRLPVTFVLDRAGVTGSDGPSHNGMWDISLLQIVPRMKVAAPRDAAQLRLLLNEAVGVANGPTAIRFPKGAAPPRIEPVRTFAGMDVLTGGDRRDGPSVLMVAVGAMAATCLEAARLLADQGLGVTVVDPRWVLPVNPGLSDLAAQHDVVAVVEDNGRVNGVGDAIARRLTGDNITGVPVRSFAIPQRFLAHGSRSQILASIGLAPGELAAAVSELAGQHAASARRREPAVRPEVLAIT